MRALAAAGARVPPVQVPVDERLRLLPPRIPYGGEGGLRHGARERVRQLGGVLAQPVLPLPGAVAQPGQPARRGHGRRPPPEPRGDGHHLVPVGHLG
ncbi:hypothetical protein SAMN05216483_4106 [Streptomyces sp. 2131.1]|nr:hypothetical protein SAMN05216483_4106 [Streptomyces sp. 2131.1]